MIDECVFLAILEDFCGKRPVGWLGPGLTQTLETPDLLAAAGLKYIGDWVYDDEPSTIRTKNGPLVTLPYTLDIHDIAMMAVGTVLVGIGPTVLIAFALWAARDEKVAGMPALLFALLVAVAGALVYLLARFSGPRRA